MCYTVGGPGNLSWIPEFPFCVRIVGGCQPMGFDHAGHIRVDGKPLVIVDPDTRPDWVMTADVYRVCRGGPRGVDPEWVGCHATIEYPDPRRVIDEESVAWSLRMLRPTHRMYRGVLVGPTSPELFGAWVERSLDFTRLRGMEWMFVQGAIDPNDGYARALHLAREQPSRLAGERPELSLQSDGRRPKVSVVIPSYNHERFIARAVGSVLRQKIDGELIVVDDGSTDGSREILAGFRNVATIIEQENAGAHAAINRGLEAARGEWVAILNSDDEYAPDRLQRMIRELETKGSDFGFSDFTLVDECGNAGEAHDRDNVMKHYRQMPHIVYSLIHSNMAISTGNFVFRRSLLKKTGGFCNMRVTHDWDFILAASYCTKIVFVDEPLYLYRFHGENTFASQLLLGALEMEQVLSRFFSRIEHHPMPDLPAFLDYVERVGMGCYLVDSVDGKAARH